MVGHNVCAEQSVDSHIQHFAQLMAGGRPFNKSIHSGVVPA